MVINKECLNKLAELTISRLIIDGIQIGWSGDYQICLLVGNKSILLDIKLYEVGTHGVRLVLHHQGVTLGVIVIESVLMFSRDIFKPEVTKWTEKTKAYLISRFNSWLTNKYVNEHLSFLAWLDTLTDKKMPIPFHIAGYNLKAHYSRSSAWFQVERIDVVIYRTERTNFMGMTTQQGWQGMNVKTIKAEAQRTIATLITSDPEFYVTVNL